jgi:transcriptional regulator with XRE-family HTH domain
VPVLLSPPQELPESPAELGALINAHRRATGANQTEAAAALGVSQSYISKLERGKLPEVHPSKEFRARLATWLTDI